jgi:hypothetical protein
LQNDIKLMISRALEGGRMTEQESSDFQEMADAMFGEVGLTRYIGTKNPSTIQT